MAKSSGLGDNFYIAGYNISGDVGSLDNISSPMATLESTGIDRSAMERLGGHRDGLMSGSTYFNDASGQEHAILKTLPLTDVQMYYARGTTLGNAAAAMTGKLTTYDVTRADDGSLTTKFDGVANAFGLDWGRQLTAGVRSDTAATNGASVDFGTGSTAFGLQAYLQVFSFTGTSVTFTIQESSDNGAGDAFAAVTGGAFTVVSAANQFERIQTSRTQTVERYLRVVTTGTFSQCSFAVMVNRNTVSAVF
jgi:hypothetical protein